MDAAANIFGDAVPTLRLAVKTRAYLFLWAKYVTGFDWRWHCCRCLKGTLSKRVPMRKTLGLSGYRGLLLHCPMDERQAFDYIYLCGVTNSYAENLHLALRVKPGGMVTYEDSHIAVTVANAIAVPIQPIIGTDLPHEYASCRNYQFGWNAYPNSLPQDGIERYIFGRISG